MRMKPALSALLLCLGLTGCGAPSNVDLCHATCDLGRRCGATSEGANLDCHHACDNNRGSAQDKDAQEARDCRNAAARRGQTLSCINSSNNCLAAVTCPAQADPCVRN